MNQGLELKIFRHVLASTTFYVPEQTLFHTEVLRLCIV